ncbi:MFS transporter [Paenarthrobacter sp. NyZ202]|uniref:MFS transporter n=1 Tax=Paenarthrobacter sp. NyZ202 TaxID=3402689 RepID=UPI003CEBE5D0
MVDSLANGVVFAFLLIYFQQVTAVPLAEIGFAMTTGRLVALATPPLAGMALDRWSPRKVIVLGNWISFVGVGVAAFATDFWVIGISQLLIQVGMNLYWTSSRSLVAIAAQGEELPRWFALLGALRNVGTGVGAVVASLFLAVDSPVLLRSLVGGSAFAFAIASILLLAWNMSSMEQKHRSEKARDFTSPPESPGNRGYAAVLTDSRYMLLLALNLVFVLAAMVLPLLLAVWVVDIARLAPGWAGGLIAANTLCVALLSTVAVRLTERFHPASLLIGAFALNALSLILLWAAGANSGGLAAVLFLTVFIVIYSAAEMLSTPYMSDLSVSMADSAHSGRYQGAFQSSWSLGMAMAPVLFATLLQFSPNLLIGILTVLCLLSILGCFLLKRKIAQND